MANKTRNKPEPKIKADENYTIDSLQFTYEKNKKTINTVATIVLAAVVGIFAYMQLYLQPRSEKAADAISQAQHYFEVDSMQRALNGDGQNPGFLRIISKYGGTKSANIAHYYAGLSYLNMGDHKNAIKHLGEFDGKGTAFEYFAYGAMGDAYTETGNLKKGIENYLKAAGDKNNAVLTPLYLFRAGLVYELDKQPEEAKKAYARIRDEYPQSLQARDMDKYLARLGVLE